MKTAEARRWVEKYFRNDPQAEKSLQLYIPGDEFAAAIEHLTHFKCMRDKEHAMIERFLWAGCRKFDRWFVPSPPSVPLNYQVRFKSFSDALATHERMPMNAPVFQIHAIRDELYTVFAGKELPFRSEDLSQLDQLAQRLANIPTPEHPVKRHEVLEARSETNSIIVGLSSGSLITRLKAQLPYPLTRRPLEFRMNWEGLPTVGRFLPSFNIPAEFFTQTMAPSVMRPVSSTRWQYGSTQAILEFHGLLDPSLQTLSLQIPEVSISEDAWPNGFRVAFEVIYLACWALREHPDYIGIWTPAPGDIGDLESTMDVPGRQEYALIRRGHPSIVHEVFIPSKESVTVELGTAPLMAWHRRCRALAHQYASFGEAREAIFWLNVGVEALLRIRMKAHMAAYGVEIDLDVLDGGKTYWDEAKQLVSSQFPDLADEIVWPALGRKPSIYQQLKYFCLHVPGTPNFNDVKSNYSKVSCHRNALFHGNLDEQIPMSKVKRAMESFDWLLDNFCVESAGSNMGIPNNSGEISGLGLGVT